MKDRQKLQRDKRQRLKHRIRKKLAGTSERPRLAVYRGNRNIEAQLIDDVHRKTICSFHSKSLTAADATQGKLAQGKAVGLKIAELAKAHDITSIVFDRSGYQYHGRVKALADGAREGGLTF